MSENQFSVDLGTLKLSDDQRNKINAAIQKAVTSELATIGLGQRLVLIPLSTSIRIPNRPIINGIIARPVELAALETLLQ